MKKKEEVKIAEPYEIQAIGWECPYCKSLNFEVEHIRHYDLNSDLFPCLNCDKIVKVGFNK